MKVKLGFGVDDDIAVMHAVRKALGSRKATLMVDSNHAYGRAEAARLAATLTPAERDAVLRAGCPGYRSFGFDAAGAFALDTLADHFGLARFVEAAHA